MKKIFLTLICVLGFPLAFAGSFTTSIGAAQVNPILAAPGPIGSVTPNTGNFTTLNVTTSSSGTFYESGTWTPSIGGTATYSTRLGSYVRVGKLASVSFFLQINVLGTGSTTTIVGVPASLSSIASIMPLCDIFVTNSSTNIVSVYGQRIGSTIQISSYTVPATSPGLNAIFKATTIATGQCTYQVF